MRIFLALLLGLLPSLPIVACDAYREYVTVYNYLLDKKAIAFTKDQASRTAFQVARGCDGAAGRFIRVFDLLINAKLTLQQSSEIAQEVAQSGDDSAENFAEVFKAAFLEKNLDLSLQDALDLARELSFKGRWIRQDYVKIVGYCLAAQGLALSKPQCATLARDFAVSGDASRERSVADALVEMMDFLRADKDGPKLTSAEALKMTQEVLAVGPEAVRNFIPGYKFAVDKNQLALDRSKAVDFARKLAELTQAPSEAK